MLLSLAASGAIFTTVSAQEVEEVIVEAEASDSDPLDDLVSAAVLDGEKLADAGIENVEDVAAYVPNLTLTQTETGTQVCIRGICQGLNQGIDPSVGMYVDKVPYPRSNMARAPFLDLAGVQVLRGPQYVNDGHYSIAGSLHLLTNLSVDEFKAGFDFSHTPSQNDAKMLLTLGGPISERWASNLVIQSQTSDGYVDNVARNESGPAKDELLARWVIGYRPTDSLSFKLKVEQGRFDFTGRQSEIIIAERTPLPSTAGEDKFLRFFNPGPNRLSLEVIEITQEQYNDALAANPGANVVVRQRLPAQNGTVAGPFEAPEDFLYRPLRIAYDTTQCIYNRNDRENPDDPPGVASCDIPENREFYFAERSFQEKLADIYMDNGLEVPLGLLDSELDFTRAADAPEKSENDSFNITLGTDLQLGEAKLSLTASYIDYEQKDLVDGDQLPVNLVTFDQEENYSQQFFLLDFESGRDGFLTYKAGISYLSSELSFEDQVNFGLENLSNEDEDNFRPDTATPADFNTDFPLMPLRAYLGGFPAGNSAVSQLQSFAVNRQFDQEADIGAVFFEGKLNWRDNLRTTLGLRYTVAEKQAVRDSVIVDSETGEVPLDFIRENPTFFSNVTGPLLQFFNLQIHTDRFLALADDRPDEVGELILAPAFGDPDVPGGTSDCLDLVLARNSDGTLILDDDGEPITIPQTNSTGVEAYCFDNLYRTARAIRGTRREEALLPSIALEWDATQDLTLIGSVRTGNKLGGYDARSTTRPDLLATGFGSPGTFEFEDETAISYELRASWFMPIEYGGLLNATLYRTDYTDLQFTRSDGATGQNVDNAGAASSVGVEIDGYINPTERLSINYSVAWTDFEFDEYLEGPCHLGERPDYFLVVNETDQLDPNARLLGLENRTQIFIDYEERVSRLFAATNSNNINSDGGALIGFQSTAERLAWEAENPGLGFNNANIFASRNSYDGNPFGQPGFCDRSGYTAQYIAEWQGTISVNYSQEISNNAVLKPTLDIIYNSGYFTDSTFDPDLAQDEFVQFNGRLELSDADERWVFALTGENLTNEKIVTFANETFGSRVQGAKIATGFVRSPRAFGLDVRYTFY